MGEKSSKDARIRELLVEAKEIEEPKSAAAHVLKSLAVEFRDWSSDQEDVDELAWTLEAAADDLAAAIVATGGEETSVP